MNEERDTEMVRLRESGLTLQEIADRFDVTRERVRQIVERGGPVVKRTRDGSIDRRTKAGRRAPAMPTHEVEQLITLILPGIRQASARMERAMEALAAFAAEHPELAEMQREFGEAMEANNDAVLPLWNLLNRIEANGDYELHQKWCDYLNGKGPHPHEAKQEEAVS